MRASHTALALAVLTGWLSGVTPGFAGQTPPPAPGAQALAPESQAVQAPQPAVPATIEPPPVANLQRLRARVLEQWRVVRVREGLVLVPRRSTSEIRGLELSRDQVYLDGVPVSGAELRDRVGGDADVVLALSFLDDDVRRQLFEPIAATRAEPATARTTTPAARDSDERLRQRHGARVRIGSDLVVGEHERVGDAAVAILGSVRVDGEVAGDVVAVGGNVRLGPRAVVRGEATAVGGSIEAHPDARVLGGSNEVAVSWPADWDWSVPVGPDLRLRLWPDRDWWASFALAATSVRLGLMGLLGLIAVLIGGRLYQRAHEELGATPWQAVVIGLGVQLVGGPLLLLLCGVLLVSVIGIPLLALVPLVLVVFLIVWLIGFAAVGERVGRRVLGGPSSTAVSPVVTYLVGFVLIAALVWLARALLWSNWIGLGAAMAIGAVAAILEGLAWAAALGAVILAWLRPGHVASTPGTVGPLTTIPADGPASP